MSKYSTDVVYKVTQEKKGEKCEMGNIYFKNVPVTFAKVLVPAKKLQSEDKAYQVNIFINADTLTKVDEIGVNKTFAEVGVTKITKGANRGQVKFKLDEHNKDYEGMFAIQLSRETVKRDKKTDEITKVYDPLKVVDINGEPFTQEIGNGSVCTIKVFGYRNQDNLLCLQMDTFQVLEHVPYVGRNSDGDTFDEEMGVTIRSVVVKEKEEAKKIVEDLSAESSDDFDSDPDPF